MKFKVFFALLLLLVTISAVCAEHNQTLESASFSDLQKKIDEAPKYSEIVLDEDYTQGSAPVKINKYISIDGKGHTIDGQGKHSLITCTDGEITLKNIIFKNGYSEDKGGAIYVSGNAIVEIVNCTFISNTAYQGGAIANWGDTVFITDSTFLHNSALLDYGGGVLSYSNSIIDNCYFEDNHAVEGGGALLIAHPKGVTTLSNSVFIKNTATGDGATGGAISNSGDLRFETCEFIQNYAAYGGAIWSNRWLTFSDKRSNFTQNGAYYGGAIYARTFDSPAMNLVFNKNYAYAYGGAVMLYYHDDEGLTNYYFINCSFNENKCEKKSVFYDGRGGAIFFDTYTDLVCELKIDGCNFSNNYAYDDGGAIYVSKGNANNNILRFVGSPSRFDSNSAESNGGAIYSRGNIYSKAAVNFVRNSAKSKYGGAIYAYKTVIFEDVPSVFEDNSADIDGGAIFCEETINFNSLPMTFTDNTAKSGGAIYTNYITDVKNSIYRNNHAEKRGGAIYVNKECHISVESSFFDNNGCIDDGGAIYLDSIFSSISLSNNIFWSNHADRGSAVFNSGEYSIIKQNWWGVDTPNFGQKYLVEWHPTLNENHYDSDPLKLRITVGSTTTGVNKAVPVEYSLVSTYDNVVDGAISVLPVLTLAHNNSGVFSNPVLNKNSVLCNYTPNEVGIHHIYLGGKPDSGGCIIVDETSEPDNVVQIFQSNYQTFTDLQRLIDNAASNSVINLDKDYAYFIHDYDKEQKGITVNKNIEIDGHGHTIDAQSASRIFYSSDGTVTLKNLVLTSGFEYDDDDGGAIFIKSDAKYVIVNCTFSNNHAWQDGGAIFNDGGELKIQNSRFTYNLAKGASFLNDCDGGAIHSKSHLIIDNCIFESNTAWDSGGAIYATGGLTIKNTPSLFRNNEALRAKGGAIRTNKFMEDIKYASFIGNTANEDHGGAIYVNSENWITFSQCFFALNHCGKDGGAIYMDSWDAHLTLSNNIFLFNSAKKEGQTVYTDGYFDKINNNWWGDNNPSSSNDQLIQWKLFESNIHHSDSDPLKIDLVFDKDVASIGDNVTATLNFYKSGGSLFTGEIFDGKFNNNYILFYVNPFLTNNVKYNKNSVVMDLIAEQCGKFDIIFKIDFPYDHEYFSLSKSFSVLNLTIVSPDIEVYYGNFKTLKIYLQGDKDLIANQKVKISLNDFSYLVYTDENGEASYNFDFFPYIGKYIISIDVLGVCKKINLNILSTISADNVMSVKKEYIPFYAQFTDGNGKNLPQGSRIGYYVDFRPTDFGKVGDNGTAVLYIDSLSVGTHEITLINLETIESRSYYIFVISMLDDNNTINNESHQNNNLIYKDNDKNSLDILPSAEGNNDSNNQSDGSVAKSVLKNQSYNNNDNNMYFAVLLIILICLSGYFIKKYKEK